jgi:hypothetical protein
VPAGARIWAIAAACDSAVDAVRRHIGTDIDARADYCFHQGACSEAASTRCAFWRFRGTRTVSDGWACLVLAQARVGFSCRVPG